MSSTVFEVEAGSEWHDYSDMVKMKGYGWARNDLDADGSGRTMGGDMWRAKIGSKRALEYQLMPDRAARYAALDTDLSPKFVRVRYADLHGIQVRTFYCSKFSCTLDADLDDEPEWSGGSFSLIER